MKKVIILLLCCGFLLNLVGCGGNIAPSPTESPPTTVSGTTITEPTTETIPPTTAVEPTEKEKEPLPTESKESATKPTVTATEPTATATPTEEIKTTVTSIAEEKATHPTKETSPSTTPQLAESVTMETEPPKDEPKTETEPTEMPATFDIDHWIAYARNYAESKGLILSSTAVDCWDDPIRAGAHCIYLERDIQSRLDHYAKDEDITDVWIWAETIGNDCYDMYIGYA